MLNVSTTWNIRRQTNNNDASDDNSTCCMLQMTTTTCGKGARRRRQRRHASVKGATCSDHKYVLVDRWWASQCEQEWTSTDCNSLLSRHGRQQEGLANRECSRRHPHDVQTRDNTEHLTVSNEITVYRVLTDPFLLIGMILELASSSSRTGRARSRRGRRRRQQATSRHQRPSNFHQVDVDHTSSTQKHSLGTRQQRN